MMEPRDLYEGAGISELGNSKFYTKVAIATFMASAAVFAYCAAYVFVSGVSLQDPRAIVLTFFSSLTVAIVTFLAAVVFFVKIITVGGYDLPVKLPAGKFDHGNMIQSKGGNITTSSVRAEIMMKHSSKRAPAFDRVSACMFVALGMALCTFSGALGAIVSQNANGVQGVLNALVEGGAVAPQLCLTAAAVVLSLLVVSVLRYAMCSQGSYMFVLSDGVRKYSDKDVECVAEKLNVSAANVLHVRVHKVVGDDTPEASISGV